MRVLLPMLALLCAGLLPACATLPPGSERDPRDPFESFNRSMHGLNDTLDRAVARPVAQGYVNITPQPVRSGVSNFFRNINSAQTIINSLLQAKPRAFLTDTARLLINTTVGIGGLFDPASDLGLEAGDEDFGQTLGRWGVAPGPYLVLPVLGPATVRDTVGMGVDQFSDAKYYLVKETWVKVGATLASLIDRRADLLGAGMVLDSTYDPYVFLRNAYLQQREYEVKDGEAPAQTEDFEIFEYDDEEMSTPAGEPTTPQAPTPQ